MISHVPGGRSSSHQVKLDGLESLTCAPSFYDNGRSKQNGMYVSGGKQVKLLQPKPVAKGIRFEVLPEPEPEPEPKPAAESATTAVGRPKKQVLPQKKATAAPGIGGTAPKAPSRSSPRKAARSNTQQQQRSRGGRPQPSLPPEVQQNGTGVAASLALSVAQTTKLSSSAAPRLTTRRGNGTTPGTLLMSPRLRAATGNAARPRLQQSANKVHQAAPQVCVAPNSTATVTSYCAGILIVGGWCFACSSGRAATAYGSQVWPNKSHSREFDRHQNDQCQYLYMFYLYIIYYKLHSMTIHPAMTGDAMLIRHFYCTSHRAQITITM